MNKFRSHFSFNKQERSGIFYLLVLVFLLQLSYFFLKSSDFGSKENEFSLDQYTQGRIDSLIAAGKQDTLFSGKPFNPNFISDFKGYVLGMSPEEIDRLHKFRKSGRYVNSTLEFQQVTKVSDSLLRLIARHFKFPEWVATSDARTKQLKKPAKIQMNGVVAPKSDLNRASASDLMEINGVGQILSARIVKFRNALGGFIVEDQLFDVYGLDRKVAQNLLERYTIIEKPKIKQVSLKHATARELSKIVYISYQLAYRIVRYRDSIGSVNSLDELTKIQDFPTEKISRIKLYLTL